MAEEKVVVFDLDSGETVHVRPRSFTVRRALTEKAEKLFPLPDKSEYEEEIDPSLTVFPGEKKPADQNPEYRQLLIEAQVRQTSWINDQFIKLICDFPEGKGKLIKKYTDERKMLSEVIEIPADEWEATLFFCLIQTDDDRNNILKAGTSNLQLTEEEIRDGMRMFRPVLRGNGHTNGTGKQESRDITQAEPIQA